MAETDTLSEADSIETGLRVAERVAPHDLTGIWRKRVTVPHDHVAVAAWPGRLEVLQADDDRRFGGAGGEAVPTDLLLVYGAEFDAPVVVDGLFTQDGEMVALHLTARVRVTDPVRVYRAMPADSASLYARDVGRWMTGSVRPRVEALVRRYAAGTLCDADTVADDVVAALRADVGGALTDRGLALRDVRGAGVLRAADAVKRAEGLRQLRAALRDAGLRERLDAARSQSEMEDTIRQIAHEHQVAGFLREEELRDLAGEAWVAAHAAPSSAGVEAPDAAGDTATSEAKDAGSTASAHATGADTRPANLWERFWAMLQRIGGRTPPSADTGTARAPGCRESLAMLTKVAGFLGSVGTIVALFTGRELWEWLQRYGISEIGRLIIAICVIGLALYLGAGIVKDAPRYRDFVRREPRGTQPIEVRSRREGEVLVRKYVSQDLYRVRSDLEAGMKALLARNDSATATELRRLRDRSRYLSKGVAVVNYQAAAYLNDPDLPDRVLSDILDVEEDLIAKADALAQETKALYDAVVDRDAGRVAELLPGMDKAMQSFNDLLLRRSGLLAN